ncbi:MAG: hypothetical protein ACYDCC_06330 [Actinomycetota bacterium]
MGKKRVAFMCAIAAILLGGGAGLAKISLNDWQASTLVHMADSDQQAAIALQNDANFVLVAPTAHFDGVYYYTIALDPFGRGVEHQYIDHSAYRYGHAGYGWLARILSPFHRSSIPTAMFLIGVISIGVASYGISRLAQLLGGSAWWGLIGAIAPGLLLSVSMDTAEPLGVALAVLGFLAWMRQRTWIAMIWLALACLVKEVFLFIPAGIVLWELTRMIRARSTSNWVTRLIPLTLSALPLVGWYVYVRMTFGAFPFQDAPSFYSAPFAGWFDSLRIAARYAINDQYSQVGAVAIPLILVIAAALLVGVGYSWRTQTPFQMIFILTTLSASFFGWRLLVYPKDILRELLLPLLLLPALLLRRWPSTRPD